MDQTLLNNVIEAPSSGVSPDEVPEAYAHASPVTAFAEQGGNLKYLRDIPIRMYTEPDVLFFLEHMTDLYSLNALGCLCDQRTEGNGQ